jgi:hypothetical protein
MVSRTLSNRIAGVFSVLVLIIGAVVVAANWSAEIRLAPTQSVTVLHERDVVTKGTSSVSTVKDETTTADINRSAWERALDPDGWLFLRLLLVVLAAFLVGAATQRILLGEYAIKIGPLELGEIGLKDVISTGRTAQQGLEESIKRAGGQVAPARAAAIDLPPSESPALQLVRLGNEITTSLRAVGDAFGIPRNVGVPGLVNELARREFFTDDAKSGLLDIIRLAQQAEQGAQVSNDVAAWAREVGPQLVAELDALQETTLCQSCKHKIPEEQDKRETETSNREPCPHCGSKQRAFHRRVQGTVTVKGA